MAITNKIKIKRINEKLQKLHEQIEKLNEEKVYLVCAVQDRCDHKGKGVIVEWLSGEVTFGRETVYRKCKKCGLVDFAFAKRENGLMVMADNFGVLENGDITNISSLPPNCGFDFTRDDYLKQFDL